MEFDSPVLINGENVGGLLTLSGASGGQGRNGYVRVDVTGNSAPITSFEIQSLSGDGWAIDHLAFTPASVAVPEPSSLLLAATCLIPFMAIARQRMAGAKPSRPGPLRAGRCA
jgi:hypothetical protein